VVSRAVTDGILRQMRAWIGGHDQGGVDFLARQMAQDAEFPGVVPRYRRLEVDGQRVSGLPTHDLIAPATLPCPRMGMA